MRLVFIAALVTGATACQSKVPPWAVSTVTALGEGTQRGEPLAIPRLAPPPVLDGKLDDAVWAGAATAGPFIDTGSGKAAPDSLVPGFARLGWDDQNLYVGFVVHDRDAASPFARDAVDPHIWEKASGVEIMLQPGDPGDNVDYYELQVDASGAVFDTHWDDYMKPVTKAGADKIFGHMDWQSHLARGVEVVRGYWVVEAALPWSSLAAGRSPIPPKGGDVWRLNLYSFRDGQRQALGWSPLRGEGNFHKASRWGRIRFLP